MTMKTGFGSTITRRWSYCSPGMVKRCCNSAQGVSARFPVGLSAMNAYTPNDFVAEGKRERNVMIHLKEYCDEVIACVRDAQAILILGSREAKGDFRTRMVSQRLGSHIAEMKSVAKLTNEQITDYVRQHFQ